MKGVGRHVLLFGALVCFAVALGVMLFVAAQSRQCVGDPVAVCEPVNQLHWWAVGIALFLGALSLGAALWFWGSREPS